MNHKRKRVALLILTLLFVVTIAGCKTNTSGQSFAKPATPHKESPYFMLDQLPDIGDYVDDIICKRRYPDTRDTLIPGEEYGQLVPFAGNFRDYHFVDYETGQWLEETSAITKYGLMTTDGQIIVDAVYDSVYIDTVSDDEYLISLYQYETDSDIISQTLLCNNDGSWAMVVQGEVSCNLSAWTEGFVIVTDNRQIDYETQTGAPNVYFYDLNGNIRFQFANCSADSYNGFCDGYIVLNFFTDFFRYEFESRFVDTTGKIVFPEVFPDDSFEDGKVCAQSRDGLYGVFTSQGKWLIAPEYASIYRSDDFYMASTGFDYMVFDLSGNKVATIDGNIIEDSFLYSWGDRVYVVTSYYDEQQGYIRLYLDAFTGQIIKCKETGMPVTHRLESTGYFYCDDGAQTYIVDFDGSTAAILPGVGTLSVIDEEHFSFLQGDWEDDTQTYSVYTFRDFQHLWSAEQRNLVPYVSFWDVYGYILRTSYTQTSIFGNSTYDLLDVKSGKPILEGLTDHRFFEVGNQIYLGCSDGTYTYNYNPQLMLLMKTRNNADD